MDSNTLILEDDLLYYYTEEFENMINDIEISPEKLNETVNFIKNRFQTYLNENNIDILIESADPSNIDLKKVGIENSAQVKGVLNKSAKEVTDVLKSEGLTKESKSKIVKIYKKTLETIQNSVHFTANGIMGVSFKELENYDKAKVQKAFALFIDVLLISIFVSLVFTLFFGPVIGAKLGSILGAPIIEETAKQVSIRGGYEKEFFIMFNIFEFTEYVLMGQSIGARLACVGLHFTTTLIQWLTNNEKVQKILKLDQKDEDSKEKLKLIGHILGFILHTTWNSFACFSPKFNMALENL